MGFLEEFLFGKTNKAIEKELGIAEDLGFDEIEDLRNNEIRKEKLSNYEYYTEEGEEDL